MASIDELCRHLSAEQAELDSVLDGLDAADWHRPSSAAGWDVLDVLAHLCFFEEAAVLALRDPDAFARHRTELLAAMAGPDRPDVAEARAGVPAADLLARWRRARAGYATEIQSAALPVPDGSGIPVRVPWYGPAMSPASFTTARILEAFAHGTDIRDGLGLALPETDRLRDVCHLAFGSRQFCFAVHGRADPGTPVRLEVTGPAGEAWMWGPADAAELITGSALDVALVWTQRRHPGRTGVRAHGPTAELWLSIAQAFAGPPTRVAPDR